MKIMPHDGSERGEELLGNFPLLDVEDNVAADPAIERDDAIIYERDHIQSTLLDYRTGVISRLPDGFPKVISTKIGVQFESADRPAGFKSLKDRVTKIDPDSSAQAPDEKRYATKWVGKEIKFQHPKEGEVTGIVLPPTSIVVPEGMMEVEFRTRRGRIRTAYIPIPSE